MPRMMFPALLIVAAAAPRIRAQEAAKPDAVNDRLFAAAACDSGKAEVILSELGLERATDPELKKLSRQMVDEHRRLNEQLREVADKQGIALQQEPDIRARFTAEALNGLQGDEFDRCYAKAQVVAHRDAVAAFEAEAERGADTEMRKVASRALPVLKAQLKKIKPICEKLDKDKSTSSQK